MSENSFIPPDPTKTFKGKQGCRIYLLRHGETANAHLICMNGHYDVALSDQGVVQIEQVAERLKSQSIDAVYSSDLQRTRVGADLIAKHHALEPVAYPELRELSFGHWEGLSVRELQERYPGALDQRIQNTSTFQADGGETFHQLHSRVIPKFLEIVERHPGGTIVIVAHGGVNRTILAHLLDFSIDNLFRLSQDYAAVNIIQYYESQVVVELMNGTHHHLS